MSLSESSLAQLDTCSEPLQELFLKVAKTYPCQVIEGHRNKEKQDEAFAKGTSKLKWPFGNHNNFPSTACDVSPLDQYGRIDWNDIKKICHFAGYVMGVADTLEIKIRWGGDFNRNGVIGDQKFFDGVHFELDKQ